MAGTIVSSLLGIVVLLVMISVVNNIGQLNRESKLDQPMGKMVMVDGRRMSVYSEGSGKNTLVFLTGSGTASPILDFKSLYSKLSKKNHIVVVEPFGYGFSDTVNVPRDLNTVLQETRTALSEAGDKGPYILFPHSMAGLEAIYWAQKYPNEVKAIVGLDPAVPESYAGMKMPSMVPFYMESLLMRIGVFRFMPSVVNSSDAIQAGHLTHTEDAIYRTVFYRKSLSIDMLNEIREIKGNIAKVSEGGIPSHTPMLFFSSNGDGTGISTEHWRKPQSNYISKVSNGEIVFLNCGHYVQDYRPTEIAQKSQEFIDSLSTQR